VLDHADADDLVEPGAAELAEIAHIDPAPVCETLGLDARALAADQVELALLRHLPRIIRRGEVAAGVHHAPIEEQFEELIRAVVVKSDRSPVAPHRRPPAPHPGCDRARDPRRGDDPLEPHERPGPLDQ
jgi:hypothetical protein